MSKLLTDHDEIREWASVRSGTPGLSSIPDGQGGSTTNLHLQFGQRIFAPDQDETRDQLGGVELVSWEEWFEALDKENLGLRVATPDDNWNDNAFIFEKRD